MRPPPANRPPDNIWFKLLIPVGFLFCATALAWVMSSFDRSGAPVVRWINRYAVWAILIESIAIAACAVIAMTVDRRQTLKTKAALQETGSGKAAVNDQIG
jgi:hypothetical protein